MNVIRNTSVIFFLFFSTSLFPQINPDTLQFYGNRMLNDKSETERVAAQSRFSSLIDSFLVEPSSFDFALEKVKSLSSLTAPDKRFRIYTWNLPLADGTYVYYGRLQLKASKKAPYRVIQLTDKSDESAGNNQKKLKPSNWYGAVYYSIIVSKFKRQTYYTLLGWDGNTAFSNKKLIEIMLISKKGEISFGAPVVDDGKRMRYRLFFEYGEKVTMSLRYDEKSGRIIYDHLSPSQTSLEGQFEFYGPDFTYDALEFKKGKWNLIRNYDARNEDQNKGNLPRKPQKGLFPENR